MAQNSTGSQYMHEGNMHVKSWLNVPYNYFYVIFYLALGVALSLHPAHRITEDVARSIPLLNLSARAVGQTLGTLFLMLSYLLWQHEPKGKWLTWATLPGVVWACYTMVNILGNDGSSWATAVFIGTAVGALIYNAELRLTLQNNETVNETLIKENVALKAELAKQKANNDQRPDQPTA